MDTKTKESLNRFITEWMGECWHDWYKPVKGIWSYGYKCSKCGLEEDREFGYKERPDWTSRERFLDLWDKAKESEAGPKYWEQITYHIMGESFFDFRLVANDVLPKVFNEFATFAEEWAIFLGWKED